MIEQFLLPYFLSYIGLNMPIIIVNYFLKFTSEIF